MTTETGSSDDFYCECSDDEKYNPSQIPDPKIWEPSPDQIIELCTKIAKGEKLEIEWTCPGRRAPSPEAVEEEKMEVEESGNVADENEQKPPTEFDFDDIGADSNPVTPRRTPGATRTPKSVQKRVARLDKILDDITRHKKMHKTLGIKLSHPKPRVSDSPVTASRSPLPGVLNSANLPQAASESSGSLSKPAPADKGTKTEGAAEPQVEKSVAQDKSIEMGTITGPAPSTDVGTTSTSSPVTTS